LRFAVAVPWRSLRRGAGSAMEKLVAVVDLTSGNC
jgi:hypothetical protein